MSRVASAAAARIGTQLKAVRQELGLTQDEVAVRAGIDSANVRSYESGRAMPSVHTLMRLAWALDVPPGELLEGLTPEHFETAAHGIRPPGRWVS